MQTAEALILWLDDVLAQKSARTRESYAYVVKRFFTWLDEQQLPTQLSDIKPMHVRAFYAKAGLKHNTLALFDRTLRAIFSRIEEQGRDDFCLPASWTSPWNAVERINPKQVDKHPLSPDQLRALLAKMPKHGWAQVRNYAIVMTLALTGLRLSELLDLQLDDLDLHAKLLRVRHGKGDKPRTVFIPPKLARVLLAFMSKAGWPETTTYLFPNRNGSRLIPTDVQQMLRRAGARIGIHLHPHLLRHTYISLALNMKQAPIKYVQDQVGHSKIQTTMLYNHMLPDEGARMAAEFSVL